MPFRWTTNQLCCVTTQNIAIMVCCHYFFSEPCCWLFSLARGMATTWGFGIGGQFPWSTVTICQPSTIFLKTMVVVVMMVAMMMVPVCSCWAETDATVVTTAPSQNELIILCSRMTMVVFVCTAHRHLG
mmetsp:Transcript_51727/g.117950  ORF Transcript_51727/g.117950 Transcript_51727/m.117950 type:complete len:129 (-) Transcript_51727:41-427(-)